jgi:hypothetical protein
LAAIATCRPGFVHSCFIRLIRNEYIAHVSNSENTASKDWMILANDFETINK